MKLAMIVSTVVLLGQINVCLAKRVSVAEVDTQTSRMMKDSNRSLDEVKKAIEEGQGKATAGRELVGVIRNSLRGIAEKLRMNQVESAVASMPYVVKILAYIDKVETLKKSGEAESQDISYSDLLKAVVNKLPTRLTADANTETMAMNNLFDNAVGLREDLAPFLSKIDAKMEAGRSFKQAFRESAQELMDKYNKRNPNNKVSSLEEFIKKIKECQGKMPS